MPTQAHCPQCGGTMQLEVVGKLHDKWLNCTYCGHRIDIPDAAEVTQSEEFRDAQGNLRKRVVTHRREDKGVASAGPAANWSTSVVHSQSVEHAPIACVFPEHVKPGAGFSLEEMRGMLERGELKFATDADRRNFEALLNAPPPGIPAEFLQGLPAELQGHVLKDGEQHVVVHEETLVSGAPGAQLRATATMDLATGGAIVRLALLILALAVLGAVVLAAVWLFA